ncbi:MAG: glutamate 5-kinase [Deltaproteobacteria bacterium]|nr:glutamate 5-kinase [Deltaproteobacteria bacterium]
MTNNIDKTRKALLKPAKRVVIKAGSGILTGKSGLNSKTIENLTRGICDLRSRGIEVIFVSSGAISCGLKKIGLSKRPSSISKQQAVAAVGQSILMMTYERAFRRHERLVAQILITRDDLNNRRRYLNARNTIFNLLSWGITPIINENDTVVVDEIKFGDNDNLSSMVAVLTDAHALIILTDMEGLYDSDPRSDKNARLISTIDKIDSRVLGYANDVPGFLGTGGMAGKISAAKKASIKGIPVFIANGRKQNIIQRVMDGEKTGTLFLPQETDLCGRKHWIAFTRSLKGSLVLDKGACSAIINRGKSLLPSGVREIIGRFNRGDSISLLNENRQEIAVGIANYNSDDITRIRGSKTGTIEELLGYKHDDEKIHRDNLVITEHINNGDYRC